MVALDRRLRARFLKNLEAGFGWEYERGEIMRRSYVPASRGVANAWIWM